MLEGEKSRMTDSPPGQLEVISPPESPTRERPRRPPAARTTVMPPYVGAPRVEAPIHYRIQRQLEKKRNLEIELNKEKERLIEMQRREQELLEDLRKRSAASNISEKARCLSKEISLLRSECSKLSEELEEEACWSCHICTFHNHPALNQCEYCSMPQGGEMKNIHIHVTHHNFPSYDQ